MKVELGLELALIWDAGVANLTYHATILALCVSDLLLLLFLRDAFILFEGRIRERERQRERERGFPSTDSFPQMALTAMAEPS